MKRNTVSTNLAEMAKKWPSSHVPRKKISEFTGGILTAKYLANLDCEGRGPAKRIKVGGQIVYEVQALIEWLSSRSKSL